MQSNIITSSSAPWSSTLLQPGGVAGAPHHQSQSYPQAERPLFVPGRSPASSSQTYPGTSPAAESNLEALKFIIVTFAIV